MPFISFSQRFAMPHRFDARQKVVCILLHGIACIFTHPTHQSVRVLGRYHGALQGRMHFMHVTKLFVFYYIGSCVHYHTTTRGGGLGSRPKNMYGERLGDGVEYHLMKPTPRR